MDSCTIKIDTKDWTKLLLDINGMGNNITHIKEKQDENDKKNTAAILELTKVNSGIRLSSLETGFKKLDKHRQKAVGYVMTGIYTLLATAGGGLIVTYLTMKG